MREAAISDQILIKKMFLAGVRVRVSVRRRRRRREGGREVVRVEICLYAGGEVFGLPEASSNFFARFHLKAPSRCFCLPHVTSGGFFCLFVRPGWPVLLRARRLLCSRPLIGCSRCLSSPSLPSTLCCPASLCLPTASRGKSGGKFLEVGL